MPAGHHLMAAALIEANANLQTQAQQIEAKAGVWKPSTDSALLSSARALILAC